MRIAVVIAAMISIAAISAEAQSSTAEIQAFNANFLALHLKNDTPGILSLWADDGVDLMPGMAPLVGKAAIASWLKAIESQMPGAKVARQEMTFQDIEVSGDWASEWATEHQIVQIKGKDPIEGYGKLALILHRDTTGQWKVKQEMWNSAPRP